MDKLLARLLKLAKGRRVAVCDSPTWAAHLAGHFEAVRAAGPADAYVFVHELPAEVDLSRKQPVIVMRDGVEALRRRGARVQASQDGFYVMGWGGCGCADRRDRFANGQGGKMLRSAARKVRRLTGMAA